MLCQPRPHTAILLERLVTRTCCSTRLAVPFHDLLRLCGGRSQPAPSRAGPAGCRHRLTVFYTATAWRSLQLLSPVTTGATADPGTRDAQPPR